VQFLVVYAGHVHYFLCSVGPGCEMSTHYFLCTGRTGVVSIKSAPNTLR
jgi:hypothetical protein